MAETVSLGMPVEVGKIGKELKKLWEDSAGATRASLVNLAVYSAKPDSLQQNTELVSRLTQNLACRAIVIAADRAAAENRVEAWISAHCHISRAGAKQVCSEQLSFLLEGPCTGMLPSIVFSHLDSDLPLFLWWQGELHDPMDPQLWAWVDRLIYDSVDWHDFRKQISLVETAQREARQRIVLCDLNWTRLDKIRGALAQFFDHPAAHHHFDKLEVVAIEHGKNYRSTAVLLAGWLAAQLKWAPATGKGKPGLIFTAEPGREINVTLKETGSDPVSRITVRTKHTEFDVKRRPGTDLLEVCRCALGEKRPFQLMPAGSSDPARLLSDELTRGGPHRVYLRAINCVSDLL